MMLYYLQPGFFAKNKLPQNDRNTEAQCFSGIENATAKNINIK